MPSTSFPPLAYNIGGAARTRLAHQRNGAGPSWISVQALQLSLGSGHISLMTEGGRSGPSMKAKSETSSRALPKHCNLKLHRNTVLCPQASGRAPRSAARNYFTI
jgi:hypothetical protein